MFLVFQEQLWAVWLEKEQFICFPGLLLILGAMHWLVEKQNSFMVLTFDK